MKASTEATRIGLAALGFALGAAAESAMRAGMQAAEADAKATDLWKDRRPLTRSTIATRGPSEGRGAVFAAGAARFLEWGTRPHTILPHGRALRFVGRTGTVVFASSVRHPGTKPRPFMHEAREAGVLATRFAIGSFVGAALRK